jgi:uncharacterized membrane protein YkoI
MMRTITSLARMTAAGMFLVTGVAKAQATKEQAAVAAALRGGQHVALGAGIAAASAAGTPISARYEVEDGKLQLSVFVQKDGAYSEIFVDHMTGKVAKTDKITGGDDMKDAKAQSRAFAKAKSTLASAVERALTANAGYTAVDVTPVLEGGHPVAEVTLMKDGKFKAVAEPLG